MTGPYAHAAGNYTRYGDVFDLLKKSDDRFVVFSSGEGMSLDFDPAKLPPLPAGWTRDYFFYADGFEKDLDFYAAHAFTVEPLPAPRPNRLPISARQVLSRRRHASTIPTQLQHPPTQRPHARANSATPTPKIVRCRL